MEQVAQELDSISQEISEKSLKTLKIDLPSLTERIETLSDELNLLNSLNNTIRIEKKKLAEEFKTTFVSTMSHLRRLKKYTSGTDEESNEKEMVLSQALSCLTDWSKDLK